MTKLIEDLAAELIRQAYAEGYAKGKFEAEMEGQFEKVKRVVEETPQAKRDRIVEQAKKDVEELINEYQLSSEEIEFVFDKEKSTVIAKIKHIFSGKILAKGIAKCAPSDCFNVHIGKAIALRRALGLEVPAEYLNAPQPTEVRVGDVVKGKGSGVVCTVTRFCDDEISMRKYGGPFRYKESLHGWVGTKQVEIIDDSREEASA